MKSSVTNPISTTKLENEAQSFSNYILFYLSYVKSVIWIF